MNIRPRQLISLDLVGFNTIGETALSRIIDVATSLTTFKVKYNNQGLTQMSCKRLAMCKKLKHVEFGQNLDYIDKIPFEKFGSVKHFLKTKLSKVQTLKLYECDDEMIGYLARDVGVLEELHIVKFI